MEIVNADASLAEKYRSQIPDLVHMTGPPSYDYQFGTDRTLFDPFIEAAWLAPRTIFSHTEARLALDGDDLLGIEIGFDGSGWNGELKNALVEVSLGLIESGAATMERIGTMAKRAEKAAWLNPHIADDAHYVLALAVVETQRGRGVGAELLRNAIERSRGAGYRQLQLDVLSDNPAVRFYRSMGLTCVAETIAPDLCRDYGVPMEMRMVLPLR